MSKLLVLLAVLHGAQGGFVGAATGAKPTAPASGGSTKPPATTGAKPSGGSTKPKECCKALIADCMSCAEGLTVAEYCAKNPKTAGCKTGGPLHYCATVPGKKPPGPYRCESLCTLRSYKSVSCTQVREDGKGRMGGS